MPNLSAFTAFSALTDQAPVSASYFNTKFSIISTNLDQLNADAGSSGNSVAGWNKGSITTILDSSGGTLSILTINAKSGQSIIINAAISSNTFGAFSGATIACVSALSVTTIGPSGGTLIIADPGRNAGAIDLRAAGDSTGFRAIMQMNTGNFQFGTLSNQAMIMQLNSVSRWQFIVDGSLMMYPDPGGNANLRLSGQTIRVATPFTPASGTGSGNTGEWASDGSYFYVCTSNASWSRATLNRF